jgi:hypothetical protein
LPARLGRCPTGKLELIERLPDVARQARAVCGQYALAAARLKQWRSKPDFECAHLMSDGRRRDAKLIGSLGKRTCASKNFERAQSAESGKSSMRQDMPFRVDRAPKGDVSYACHRV